MTHPYPSAADRETRFPQLSIYDLRLRLELGAQRQILPKYLGSTVRGVVAASFRDLVCVTQASVCDGCLLLNRCPYPYIFETPPPPHISEALQKRFRQAPRPYILDVPLVYRGDPTLEVGLVLVGQAFDFLPYFIYVLNETGKRGLGRSRVPYRLVSVVDGRAPGGAEIFRADAGVIRDDVAAIILQDLQRPGDAEIEHLSLEFLTPLRIKKFGGYQESGTRIDFSTLIDLLLGRLEALAFFHCGATWEPHIAWRHAARGVQVVEQHLALQRLERYSNRRRQKLPLHGMVGSLSFTGNLAPFLPLLRMGEYVHIGAGTAFGLGRYRLREG